MRHAERMPSTSAPQLPLPASHHHLQAAEYHLKKGDKEEAAKHFGLAALHLAQDGEEKRSLALSEPQIARSRRGETTRLQFWKLCFRKSIPRGLLKALIPSRAPPALYALNSNLLLTSSRTARPWRIARSRRGESIRVGIGLEGLFFSKSWSCAV